MKKLTCEMCGSTDLVKQDGIFVCQSCGTKYSVEEAKKMMVEGTVDVTGSTIKLDNSSFVEKYLENARRAKQKEDWGETEKYYNMVEQNDPQNIEAVFYSSYAKARQMLNAGESELRADAFKVLGNCCSLIDDYFDASEIESETKRVKQMSDDLFALFNAPAIKLTFVSASGTERVADRFGNIARGMYKEVEDNFCEALKNIINKHPETEPVLGACLKEHEAKSNNTKTTGCYVATAVYGSYDCPQVWTLRRYRDYTLAESWYGRAFIHAYYAISPTLVKWFGNTNWFKRMWQGSLDRMVAKLQSEGVESTPYEDRVW